ncbi:MAG: nucleotide sugar dehydrogenase [Acidimicrobiia bacterium]|nr:nucleotide sugar dehydrogenase [Acidimicrobiia bacterium]
MGYVGTVSAACLADAGHDVVGVDIDDHKVEMVNAGRSPVIEEDVTDLVSGGVRDGRLRATADAAEAVASAGLSLICVGTPSAPSGGLHTEHLEKVLGDIGRAMTADDRHLVVLRSTVLPGTSQGLLVPLLEKVSGLTAGRDFGYCTNPEFLREGSSVKDFRSPPKTVVGTLEGGDADAQTVIDLYRGIDAPRFVVDLGVAEMIKYADNTFHALKVAFGNEIGSLCRSVGIDGHELMDVFLADTKLNVSPAYLRPGMPFGGSCLPKDLRALLHEARHSDIRLPLLESVLPSNTVHADRIFEQIQATGSRRVSVYGLAFKVGTDDLRESPMVDLCERLVGRGYELVIFDPEVSMASIRGANRAYIDTHIPHLSRLLVSSPDTAAQHAEVHVVARADEQVVGAIERSAPGRIIDLVRGEATRRLADHDGYRGIAW